MAQVGSVEKLVEGLVNRGLVAPKFVGRQIGQATIDELHNLGSNLAESQATRANTQQQQQTDFFNKTKPVAIYNGSGAVNGINTGKPQIIGKNLDSGNPVQAPRYTVLNPLAGGKFSLSTQTGLSDIVANLSKGLDLNSLPELNTNFYNKPTSANIDSIGALQAKLAQILKDPAAYQQLIGA